MIAIVATIKVKPGMEKTFEDVAAELVAQVNAKEEGCLLYSLHRAPEAQTYVFLERYRDDAALETHRGTAHFKEIGGRMGPCLDGRPQILRLTQIA